MMARFLLESNRKLGATFPRQFQKKCGNKRRGAVLVKTAWRARGTAGREGAADEVLAWSAIYEQARKKFMEKEFSSWSRLADPSRKPQMARGLRAARIGIERACA
jgi:hypothetical protein